MIDSISYQTNLIPTFDRVKDIMYKETVYVLYLDFSKTHDFLIGELGKCGIYITKVGMQLFSWKSTSKE